MKSLMMASGTSPRSSPSPPLLDGRPLKKEPPDDEIKEFAETAMNELLGWYGYEARGGQGPKGPMPARGASSPNGQPAASASPSDDPDECSWCKNPIPPEATSLSQSVGDRYCSELCFSQSRRATFKRAKTCDWCRHVRHTVSYVDFQDGATQLQFCSDKCLNQYKMHIFCRETQAHLDLNPHLISVTSSSSSTSLITPDLWMKNCRSRSVSPSSERSASSPTEGTPVTVQNPPLSPKSNTVITPPLSTPTQALNKPVISVTPASKLMKSKNPDEKLQTNIETRREHRMLKANSKKRRSARCVSAAPQPNPKLNITKPQDLRISTPPLSHEGSPNPPSLLPTNQNTIPSPPNMINQHLPNVHQPNFMGMHHPPFFGNCPPNFQDPRLMGPQFIPPPNFLPRHPMFPQDQMRPPIPPFHQGLNFPPVTMVVPYPVIVPIPFPIPVPIPILEFSKALSSSNMRNKNPPAEENPEEPLDFTTNQRRSNDETPKEVETQDCVESEEPKTKESTDAEESVDIINPENTLPKFQITKLAKGMSPKKRDFSESARPLRKRARLVEIPTEEESVVNKASRKPVHA